MKSIISIIVFTVSITLAYSQKNHIKEDFNSTQNINSLPLWTSPTQANWIVSNDVLLNPGNQSINGSNLAYLKGNNNFNSVGYLYSPIFDNTTDSLTHLTFDYNFHSDTFQFDTFFVEIFNNHQWIRVFSRTTDDCGSFLDSNCIGNFPSALIDLSSYQNNSSQLRFGYSYLANNGRIAAIDNVVVYSQKNNDLNLFAPITEYAGCSMLDSITVFLSNEGFNTSSSANISYQLNGGSPVTIGSPSTLLVNDTVQFNFLVNNLIHGRNEIKVFHNWQADENKSNDTINIIIQNYMIDSYHTEDFESFVDGPCKFVESQIITNGWFVNPNKLFWSVESNECSSIKISQPQLASRPNAKDGNYLYTSSSLHNNSTDSIAVLNSPCIDLSSFSNPQLSFWYHKLYTTSGKIQVEVFDTSSWVAVSSIQGQSQTNPSDPWKLAQIDLSAYANKTIQIRFLGDHEWRNSSSTPMPILAIDEIVLFDQLNQDIGILDIVSPSNDSCSLPSNANIQVLLVNFGSQNIALNSLSLELYHNDSLIQTETVSSSINIGDSLLYTFNTTLDLSNSGEHQIAVKAILSGDTLIHNNRFHIGVYNQSVQLPYFYENFENTEVGHSNFMDDDLNGWTRQPDSINTYTWQVWQGSAPLINGDGVRNIPPNGPSGDHTNATYLGNGDGKYIKLKSDFTTSQPPAHLISPCGGIDLTTSANNKVTLSFWYHMFGNNTTDLFVDIHNGTQWVNGVSVIRGQQQWESKQPWRRWQVSLNNFTNVSNAKIRFRASGISSTGGGDIGLDDIRIFDRKPTDLALLGFRRPESGCGLSSQEQLRVSVQNTGTSDIYRIDMAYQLTYTDLYGNSQTYPIVREFDVVTVINLASYTFNFSTRLDLSLAGSYQIKVWSEISGDGYAFNDTLVHTVKNTLKPSDYCEDFNELGLNEQPQFSYGNYNMLSNDWAVSHVNNFYFKPTTLNNSHGVISRSKKIDDIFILKTPIYNQQNFILTPCIEIADSAKQLSFWYNIGSQIPYWIIVKGNKNQAGFYEVIDSIYVDANHLNGWNKAIVKLADYRNTISQFEISFFEASGGSLSNASYFALDDFCISDAGNQEIQLTDFPKIFTTECGYSNQESMQFTVRNVGKNPIDSFMVISTVDTNTRKSTNHYFTDTSWFYPSPSLNFDDVETYTINSTVDMSHKAKYIFNAKVVLPTEKVKRDNVYNKNITNKLPIDTNYTTDFENYHDRLNGLILPQNNGFNFKVIRNGNWPSVGDHTKGSNGYYLLTDPSTNNTVNDTAFIYTPCFDLNMMATPTLSFWYHKTASPNYLSKFQINVRANGTGSWQALDSVGGTSFGQNSPYLNKVINLSNYTNQIVQFRIAAKYENGHYVAIDDIQVVDSLITSINNKSTLSLNNYHLYPNPSEGQFILDVDQSFIGELYQIRELSGKLVQEGRINSNSTNIQLNDKAKGIYFLSIPTMNVQEKVVVY